MDINLLLRGIILGFSIAAPVGPIGVLCIRYTLTHGRTAGLASGLGAATADAIYGCIAGFGLTFISSFLISHAVWLHLGGGIFLCYLGVKTFLTPPAASTDVAVTSNGIASTYTSTLFLTLTNPMTILSFVTIFAGLGLAETGGNYIGAVILVLGVFTGSAAWWLLLSSGVSWWNTKFNLHRLQLLNRLAGVIIIAFGIVALLGMIG
ncbi:MAG: LysE family transporter [Hormoscilla sp. SP12CHS1]|nr:LysE family transporter [Hormoscilla sp. SP12CHS1]